MQNESNQLPQPKVAPNMDATPYPYLYEHINTAGIINALSESIHADNVKAGWWNDIKTGEPLVNRPHFMAEKLCLVHSEISEAMEGLRKNLKDDKLPHREMMEVELADALIRICDIAAAKGYDLGGAVMEKRYYNSQRADHKIENRLQENGKKF